MKISSTSMMDNFNNTNKQLLHLNNPGMKFSTGGPGISVTLLLGDILWFSGV